MKVERDKIYDLWNRVCTTSDDKAFEALFYLLNNKLIRFCVLYVHQREIAEEIVSDAFVKCWINRASLAEVQNPSSYLFVAVKNLSLNYVKKFSSIHLVELDHTDNVQLINVNDPQKELENKELYFKMDQAIDSLPRQCRIVFRLIKEDEMKYKEVAEILNISPRTVQTQLFRAVKKLGVVLLDYQNPDLQNGFNQRNILSAIIIIWALQIFFSGL
ncbi:RNA polymerase sigma-70 factor [Mucilaginibacter sp.]|jgi:RNA polymerase sigma-70 factor (ECF subfamily)|uniref:RNA polymerase sigma-70 factor n=1 Tax=Mucilaginibacter sp. TaxID=1882438 RepID=UPI0035636DA8